MARLHLEDVQQEVSSFGWKLCTTEYKSIETAMEFECPMHHKTFFSQKVFRKHQICPVCISQANAKEINDKIPKKEKGVIRVLALDDSTSVTGWALFDDGTLIGYGKITMSQQDTIKRIAGVRQWLLSALSNWKPDVVGIEDIQQQTGTYNVSMFKTLAHQQGTLLVTQEEEKVEKVVVHSATWRSDCEFKSKTRMDQKREAQKKVLEWYNIGATQDEADAICIGRYLANQYVKNNFLLSWGE